MGERRRWRRHVRGAAVAAALVAGACGNTTDDVKPTPPTTAPAPTTTTAAPATTTTNPPVTGTLAVEGELVRGATAIAIASGLPQRDRMSLVVSDAGQRIPVADVTPAPDGTARIEFTVPSVGLHEGSASTTGPASTGRSASAPT